LLLRTFAPVLKHLRGQFHQCFTSNFYVHRSQKRKKTLLWSGVNFINILQAAFTHQDPKSAKNTVKFPVFFCAFGIWAHKSCLKNVDEIDPRDQFHQCSMYSFYTCRSQKRKKTVKVSIFSMLLGSTRAKALRKILIKLTLAWVKASRKHVGKIDPSSRNDVKVYI